MKRLWFSVVTVAAVMTLGLSGALATTGATPGVSSTTIDIGATFPLSGPVSFYAPIAKGMKAYFSYVNSRKATDGRRGVNGRQIHFNVLDDQYIPANAVQATRQLVEQDHVFAMVGGLGTANQVAVRDYLRRRLQEVPVDDRLAADVPRGGLGIREVPQRARQRREGRRPLPERRLRPRLSELVQGGAEEQEPDRGRGGLRGNVAVAAVAGREAEGLGRGHVPRARDADGDDPVARDRVQARLEAEAVRELRFGDGYVPHRRAAVGRLSGCGQRDHHRPVPEGSGRRVAAQGPGHQALLPADEQVRTDGRAHHGHPLPLRDGEGAHVRHGALPGRKEPDARLH